MKKAKKAKKAKLISISKAAPANWPTEEMFAEVERRVVKKSALRILPPDVGLVERTKHELCGKFIEYFLKEQITQRELTNRLSTTENRVSEILSYEYDTFTIDRLIELLSRIKPNLKIKVA